MGVPIFRNLLTAGLLHTPCPQSVRRKVNGVAVAHAQCYSIHFQWDRPNLPSANVRPVSHGQENRVRFVCCETHKYELYSFECGHMHE
ncbi:hypothetical protein GDO78_020038 [Eleutherodactylus coqui]|uniref:Uncharacterized protein n=1 Tax=Eleutherodactylus coqui TaxID=57060 RepID=A0A8J6BIM4_ELECQ|nr:hypothetical protein GDO78_020038 [Eleutherodactylus coqui]